MFDFSAKGWNQLAKALCALSFLTLPIAVVCAVNSLRYLKRSIITQATITELIEHKNDDGDALYAPVYVFIDQRGNLVEISSLTASSPPPGKVGNKIDVLYDPADPKDSKQNTFFDIWGTSAMVGGLGIFYCILFGAIALLTGRHIHKKGEAVAHRPA